MLLGISSSVCSASNRVCQRYVVVVSNIGHSMIALYFALYLILGMPISVVVRLMVVGAFKSPLVALLIVISSICFVRMEVAYMYLGL